MYSSAYRADSQARSKWWSPSRRSAPVVAALLLAFIALGLMWFTLVDKARADRAETAAAAIRDNQNRVIAFERYIARTLETAEVAAAHLAERYARRGAAGESWAGKAPIRIEDAISVNPIFAAVAVADARGDIIASTVAGDPPLNVAGTRTFRGLRDRPTSRLVISRPRASERLGNRPTVALARGIVAPDGSFAGIVVIQIEAERLVAFNEDAAYRAGDLISVIRLDGVTIARRTAGRFSYGEDLRGKLVMRMQYRNPNGTYLGPSAIDGVARYFSHRRLADYPLFATSGVGHAEIMRPADTRRRLYYAGGGLVTLASLALIASLLMHSRRRDESERALAEVNERLREAQRIARIGDWELDPERRVVVWSDELCAMYGRAVRDDAFGIDELLAYFDDRDSHRLAQAFERGLRTGEPDRLDLIATQPCGERLYRRLVIAPVKDGQGRVVRLVGTDQDVTLDKLHEKLTNDVAHMARVDAINTMAATLAHELSQPLTAASNYIAAGRYLAEATSPDDPARLKDALDHAQSRLRLATEIVRRAKEMVSSAPCEASIVSLAEVVDDTFALVSEAARPRVDLRRSLDPAAQSVIADRIQLQQVLINLVRNACDAVAEVERPVVEVSSRAEDGKALILVSDNGPGLPAEFDDEFVPFASSKKTGLGLGLAISRSIVQAHGGRLWAERKAGPGATFCLLLPLSPAAAEPIDDSGLAGERSAAVG